MATPGHGSTSGTEEEGVFPHHGQNRNNATGHGSSRRPAPDWIWAELHPKERQRPPYLAAARGKKKKPAPAKKQQQKATKAPREKKKKAAEATAARVVAPPASSHICSARRHRHRLQERHAVPKLEDHRCGGQWLSDCHHAGPTPGPGLGFGGRAHWRLQVVDEEIRHEPRTGRTSSSAASARPQSYAAIGDRSKTKDANHLLSQGFPASEW